MKRTFLCLLTVILSGMTVGQEIPDYLCEGKIWSRYCMLYVPNVPSRMEYNWFDGADTVNGIVWRKLFYSYKADLQDKDFFGWYRQEGKKIYERREWPNGEELLLLLFDFGAKEGDTIFVHNSERQIIDRIFDTVFACSDGTPSRCFQVSYADNRNFKDTWIEGIGSLQLGITASWLTYSGWVSELLCCEKDGNLLYQNTLYNTCSIEIPEIPDGPELPDTVSNHPINKETIPVSVRTEPHRAVFSLLSPTPENVELTIFDLTGQQLSTTHFQNGEASTPYLPTGLYIYHISVQPEQGKHAAFHTTTGKIRIN